MPEIPRLQATQKFVMPAEAGIQEGLGGVERVKSWIPACAGMTGGKSTFSRHVCVPSLRAEVCAVFFMLRANGRR